MWKIGPIWPASAVGRGWPHLGAAPGVFWRRWSLLGAILAEPWWAGCFRYRPAAAFPSREAVTADAATGDLLPWRREQRTACGLRRTLQRTLRRALALPLLLT